MSNKVQNQYIPDLVLPPGETLLEKIEELGMSQAELAQRMGRPKKTINEIIRGKAAITPETALQLERVLGIPAHFWSNYEQLYRQYKTRGEEEKRLSDQVDWLQCFPIKTMITKDWLQGFDNKVQQLRELLNFFAIASPDQWEVQWETVWNQSSIAFRKTPAFKSNREALSAWLRRGEINAQQIYCKSYAAKAFRQVLREVRCLTLEPPRVFRPKLVDLCADAGVAVVFVPQLPKSRVGGATRWLAHNKALIQLSLRYKTDDHLWFTFFHEAGHILLHGKRVVFLEEEGLDDAKEQQANIFAAKTLIPPADLRSFLKKYKPGYLGKQSIQAFADEIGIAPGIVVGRLQYEGYLPYTHCNDLKRTFKWAN